MYWDPRLSACLTFKGIVCLGYFHPVVMGALVSVSLTLATIPVMEIETGFIDLVLARPVARHWIVTRSILAALISTVYLLAMMALGTWLGLRNFAAKDAGWPSVGLVGSLAINLGFLMLCWAAIAMAIGCACRRRGSAGAIAGLLALTAYLTDYVGRAWKPAESVAWLSPFRYYTPFELVMGSACLGKEPVRPWRNRSCSVRAGVPALFAQRHLTLTPPSLPPAAPVHLTTTQCPAPVSEASIFSIAWSMVKLAAFWRGGNCLNVSRKGTTIAFAAKTM